MSVWVQLGGHSVQFNGPVVIGDIKSTLSSDDANHIYFTYNGKKLEDYDVVEEGIVRVSIRILGGKGGFGSMLRAIGAQIEKTTNREACRDLSGRRLRDINEEKRLKNWIAQQAEREREAAERRKKKMERLCYEPKHDFTDKHYEKSRTELTEKVHDAVEQGFRSASTSTSSIELKRKLEPQKNTQTKKQKTCLWVDDIDEDELSSDGNSDAEETEVIESNVKSNPKKLNEEVSNDKHKKECSTNHENNGEDLSLCESFWNTNAIDKLSSLETEQSDVRK